MNEMLPSNDVPMSPPPSPQKKDTVTFNKKNLAIAFLAVSIFILIIAIVVPGDKTSSPADTTPAPIVTNPPAPVKSKYDRYIDHVLNESGQANTWTNANLIEFGDLVCQSLNNGSSIREVVNILSRNVKNDSDIVFFAAVVRGAIENICPEYMNDLRYYLNS